jgi:hypothetical protein
MDKKDDIMIVLFFLFYFLDYIVQPSIIKKTPGSGLLWKFPTFSGGKKVPSIKKKRNRSQYSTVYIPSKKNNCTAFLSDLRNLFRLGFLLHIRLDASYSNSHVNKESGAK